MTQATKIIEGYFGPKQITRDEFIKRWTGHFSELFYLARSSEELTELTVVSKRIADMAGDKWDKIPAGEDSLTEGAGSPSNRG